jgi:hypothetical protein
MSECAEAAPRRSRLPFAGIVKAPDVARASLVPLAFRVSRGRALLAKRGVMVPSLAPNRSPSVPETKISRRSSRTGNVTVTQRQGGSLFERKSRGCFGYVT